MGIYTENGNIQEQRYIVNFFPPIVVSISVSLVWVALGFFKVIPMVLLMPDVHCRDCIVDFTADRARGGNTSFLYVVFMGILSVTRE